jgi:hypothetical protein
MCYVPGVHTPRPYRPLALFTLALAILFGVGAAAGALLDPQAPGGESEHAMAADPVRGLGVAEHGLRLVIDSGRNPLRFRVLDEDGAVVRDFDLEHTKRMHLIVVRRDLTGFQHLHPRMAADGTWSAPLRLGAPGSYRMFADFVHDGEPTTLAGDLNADGAVHFEALPAAVDAATSDAGALVRLDEGAARPGEETDLRFDVTSDGRPAAIESYLGAGGHLVALRDGDLAFLHVHPTFKRDGSIGFAATFPTAGRYRLFLQFRTGGRLHTVAFTQEVPAS